MSELKQLYPYLYRRVRLKGILFSIFGITSLFSNYLDALFHTQRNTATGMSVYVTGSIFLAIGAGILISLYASNTGYKIARKFLYVAFFYALFWAYILLFLLIGKHISTLSVFILWAYLTYNLYLISWAPAWSGAELVKEIRKDKTNGARD